MKKMSRLFLSIILFFSTSYVVAQTNTFNQIVFFGDSLSDDGNLFFALDDFFPKSPPYFDGNFSNGFVWSKITADYFENKYDITSLNYAYGGQTAIFHNPFDGFLPYTISMSLDNYLLKTAMTDRSTTLYVIWIGANDYLPGSTIPDELTTKVTDKIGSVVSSLIYYGGKNFLLINMPNLGATPYSRVNASSSNLTELSMLHNTKLQEVAANLQLDNPDINLHVYDVDVLFTSSLKNINRFNAIYKSHIINTQDSCWQGGYSLKRTDNALLQLRQMLLNEKYKKLTLAQTDSFNDFILKSPALLESYRVAQSLRTRDLELCDDPDNYFFWDHVHPTRIVHTVLSQVLTNYIEQNYKHE